MARQRPPQAIRDAMAEVGMGSMKNYEAIIRASASANADASRAFYPVIKGDRKVEPMQLMQSEHGLVCVVRGDAQLDRTIAAGREATRGTE